MYPADASWRTSSAPTARSSGSRSSACATSTSGRRRSCAWASRWPRRARRSRTPTCPTRCWWTTSGGRSAGCRERALPGERVTDELRSPAEPVVELDDVLRDALADLLQHETQYGPVVDARGAVAGVLSIEIIGHALQDRPRGGAARRRRAVADDDPRAARPGPDPRALEGRRELRGGQRLLPDWIVDNLDRYVDPFVEHVYLTVVSVAIGFAIAFALALLAHRRRWLIGPITQITGILYTLPSLAVFFLLLPITGRGNTTAIIALVAYTLLIIFRNVMTGLDNVPARDQGRRARHGAHRPPAALARGAAARAARDPGRACGSPPPPRSGSPRSRSSPAPAASASRSSPTSTSSRTWWRRAACAVLLAAALDGLILLVQRARHAMDAGEGRMSTTLAVPRRVRRRDRLHLPRARPRGGRPRWAARSSSSSPGSTSS